MSIDSDYFDQWKFAHVNIFDPLWFPAPPPLVFNNFVAELVLGNNRGKIDFSRHPWPFKFIQDCRISSELCREQLLFSFTAYENVLFLRSEDESYFLYACNTIRPTAPLISFALLSSSSDHIFVYLPFSDDKRWRPFDLISKFSASFPGIGLQTRSARVDAFRDVKLAQRLYICTHKNKHLGHYVLNDLGPSNHVFRYIKESDGSILFARINPGFLPDDAEISFIAGDLLSNDSFIHFPGLSALRQYIKTNNFGLFLLHGANTESTLALAVQNYMQSSALGNKTLKLINDKQSSYSEIFVISIRVGNRAALNIAEVAELCFLSLPSRLQKEGLFLIDGLASQHNAPKNNTTASLSIEDEACLAQSIVDKILLRGGSALSLVGMSLLEQLAWMQNATMALAHISSASVKYLCLLGKPQLLHSASGKRLLPLMINPWTEGVDIIFSKAYKETDHPIEIFTDKMCVERVVPIVTDKLEPSKLASRSNYILNARMVALLFYAFHGGLSRVSREQ